jgi:hypothetical protein
MNCPKRAFDLFSSEMQLQVSVEETPTGWIVKLDNFKVLSSQDHLYSLTLNKITSCSSNQIPNTQRE